MILKIVPLDRQILDEHQKLVSSVADRDRLASEARSELNTFVRKLQHEHLPATIDCMSPYAVIPKIEIKDNYLVIYYTPEDHR